MSFAFAILALATTAPAIAQTALAQGAGPAETGDECSALRALRIELSKYANVDSLSIDEISTAGRWAFASFHWGGAGGDALLVRNAGSWILRRAGGGEMSEPILIAFGVDAASATLLRTTRTQPPACPTVPPPSPSPKPTPRPTVTPAPTSTPKETLIPADHPLGNKYPMLITTIDLRIPCFQKFADRDAHTDLGQWPDYVEDAIRDGQRMAPHDPALPRFVHGMEIYYKKAHNDKDADRMRAQLRKDYPWSAFAKESLYQIGIEATRPAVCHIGIDAFSPPVTNKTP